MMITEINTKQRIRHKADELFMRYGFRSVSMDDIALSLGISKKTIYQFFADKNELVDAVLEEILDYNKENCNNNRIGSTNAVEEVFLTMEMIEQMFVNMHPSVIYDMQKFHCPLNCLILLATASLRRFKASSVTNSLQRPRTGPTADRYKRS